MAGLLEQMDINTEDFENIKEQKAGGTVLDSAVYEMAIDTAFIRKTDSGAKMLELTFLTNDDTSFRWSTCTQSGDEKGNKATYTDKRSGKERDLPGVISLKHFLDAIGEKNPAAVVGEVVFGDKTIEALCITGVQGKKLKLGINQYENEYNGNVGVKNDIIAFMDLDGNNRAGELIEDKITAKLIKNPIKRLKVAGGAQAPAGDNGAAAVAAKGW